MDKRTEYLQAKDYQSFLDSVSGEREIAEYLRTRPQLLYWMLCRRGGHARYVFKEFPLGNRYKADYVVLNSYSGVWEVLFIELEPVNAKFFTKAGTPSQRILGAIKQVDDWRRYFDEHKAQVRSDLVLWAAERDLLRYSSGETPLNLSGNLLADPETYLRDQYYIVAGRRESLNSKEARRKAEYYSAHSVEIISYDRISDVVTDRYANPEYWLQDNG
jgi:hypothetical protein